MDDVGCVLKKKLSLQPGRLFVFDSYLCFYSKSMGQQDKLVLPFKDIIKIKKAKSLGLIQNAVKIFMPEDRMFYFRRIKNRDQFYEVILKLWFQQSIYA